MIQFFAPDIQASLTLPESESQHCIKVLRHAVGDQIEVVDGNGSRFACTIVEPHHKHVKVVIDSRTEVPKVWPNFITVAIAPTKHNDRMEWLVEKLVEIGVDRIVPLRCRYSERKELNVERLEKIAVSAMKQSLKAVMPTIEPMMPFAAFLDSTSDSAQRFIAYCDPSIPRRLLAKEYRPAQDATILIGPEGDFSPEEIRRALDDGWMPVSLGDNRLRTETAALVAVDTFQILNIVNQ